MPRKRQIEFLTMKWAVRRAPIRWLIQSSEIHQSIEGTSCDHFAEGPLNRRVIFRLVGFHAARTSRGRPTAKSSIDGLPVDIERAIAFVKRPQMNPFVFVDGRQTEEEVFDRSEWLPLEKRHCLCQDVLGAQE